MLDRLERQVGDLETRFAGRSRGQKSKSISGPISMPRQQERKRDADEVPAEEFKQILVCLVVLPVE